MIYIKQYEASIKDELKKIQDDVHIKVFTDHVTLEDGTEKRYSLSCIKILNFLNILSAMTQGKLKIEEISIVENEDIVKEQNIIGIPTTILLNNQKEELIRFVGGPLTSEIPAFLKTLVYISGVKSEYNPLIEPNIPKFHNSVIKMFVASICPYCPTIVPMVNSIAIHSQGKIRAEIIDIDQMDNVSKYNITRLPHLVINEKINLAGVISFKELMDVLTTQ